MINKKAHKLLWISIILPFQLFSQTTKTCDTPEGDPILDLNSITKCSVEEKDEKTSSKAKNIAVEVTSRRRVVRKRDEATGILTNSHQHEVEGLKKKENLISSLDFDKEVATIPFAFVDEIPLFNSCKSVPFSQQSKCFKTEITNHIKKHFTYPEKAFKEGVQGRVIAHFDINSNGSIGKAHIVSPYKGEALGDEAERIIRKLPKLKAGKHGGRNVIVRYSVPITFQIPGVKPSNVIKVSKKVRVKDDIYSFDQLETVPGFKTCQDANDSSLNCFNQNLVNHVQENFAYPKDAVSKSIEGVVYANFTISKEGEVINVETKGPANTEILEKATKVLVEKLPKFTPATKKGKPVYAKYTFPVRFKLN